MFLLWRRGSCRSGACPVDAPALEAWFLPPNFHEAFVAFVSVTRGKQMSCHRLLDMRS